MSTPGRYHDKCGGRSLGKQLNLYENPSVLNIPWCIAQTLCRVIVMKTWENVFLVKLTKTFFRKYSARSRTTFRKLENQ